MAAEIKVATMANGDNVIITWRPPADLLDCLGFAIERRRNDGPIEVLKNRVSDKESSDPKDTLNPSTVYPFRRVSWTDHGVDAGDRVRYRVKAMLGTLGQLREGPTSAWTDEIALTNSYGPVSAYFNRGIVLSQFASRVMREHNWTPADLKENVGLVDNQFRRFLSGQLRVALLELLDKAAKDTKCHVYAALFELTDEELVDRLVALGPRLHIVLANGAVKHSGDDENAGARVTLEKSHAQIFDRMCAPRFLGHNKFLAIAPGDKPAQAWTGSTNWQPTGLCTQANNGILIDNAEAASVFKAAWDRLSAAGDDAAPVLVTGNSKDPVSIDLTPTSAMIARFTRVREGVDMEELLALIREKAQKSILFAMFMPGQEIFGAVKAKQSSCFVRGVVNTFPARPGGAAPDDQVVQDLDESKVNVDLLDGRQHNKFDLDVVSPEGIPHAIGNFVAEVTRRQFSAIGHAIIHSKVLVLDADSDNPYLVTGSHNFSKTASQKNDENFVVIHGNRDLARAYAVECLALYDHYRWRQTVARQLAAGKKPWSYGSDLQDKQWLSRYVDSKADLLGFFGV